MFMLAVDNQIDANFPLWIPVVFWGFGIFLILQIFFIGGWARMAKVYRAQEEPWGRPFLWRSGKVGWASYSNCLNFHVTQEGLFVGVILIFQLGSPTLFIPWCDMQVIREDIWLFFHHTVTVGIGDPRITTITMPRDVLEQSPFLQQVRVEAPNDDYCARPEGRA